MVESSTELEAQLVLNNLLGQVVWQQPVTITAGQQQHELPVQTLDAGTYSLSLVHATGQWTKRLIIRK